MIRVILADGGQQDFDANAIDFAVSGWVVLNKVELREVTNPQNLADRRMQTSQPQLVQALGPGQAIRLINLDLEVPAAEAAQLQEATA